MKEYRGRAPPFITQDHHLSKGGERMKEVFGDALVLRRDYTYLCVTSNGFVKKDGTAVMGAGIAKSIAKKDPAAPARLGTRIKKNGNIVQKFYSNVLAFPVKHNWWEVADIELIKESCRQLVSLLGPNETALLPRPGCGNGKLKWSDVKTEIEPLLDDRVSIVHWKEDTPKAKNSLLAYLK